MRSLRWAAFPVAILVLQAFGTGCASSQTAARPRVAIVQFADARENIIPQSESVRAIGDEGNIAGWTTDALARRLTEQGFDVITTTGEVQSDVSAVVTGDVYRWDIAAFGKFLQYYGTAIARSHVTVVKNGLPILDRVYTGDDTEVHATEFIYTPGYNPSIGPLQRSLRNMMDDMAADVINVLNESNAPEAVEG